MSSFDVPRNIDHNLEETVEKDGNLKVIDIIPEKEKTGVPVLVAPGWANTHQAMRESLGFLAEKGRRVL